MLAAFLAPRFTKSRGLIGEWKSTASGSSQIIIFEENGKMIVIGNNNSLTKYNYVANFDTLPARIIYEIGESKTKAIIELLNENYLRFEYKRSGNGEFPLDFSPEGQSILQRIR